MPNCTHQQRRGAIVPLFAFLLPVLLIFCSMAINLAYVQLTNTEMQVVVDVAVHAGGRRLGTPVTDDGEVQTLAETKEDVKDFAAAIAAMNVVAGRPAVLPESVMEFGRSTRAARENGTFESYEFHSVSENQIPSSFRIASTDLELPFVFGAATPSDSFSVNASSVSTQVDRDVVLVLDRSGSMLYFEDTELLDDTLFELSQETFTEEGEVLYEYRVQFRRSGISWRDSIFGPYMTEAEFAVFPDFPERNEYRLNFNNRRVRQEAMEVVHEKITDREYDDARDSLYDKWFSSNVIYWLEDEENSFHDLGDDPETWTNGLTVDQQRAKLTGHMAIYAHDYRYRYKLNDRNLDGDDNLNSRRAPAFSRWYHLDRSVEVFLNVLGGGVDPDGTERDGTVQKELVSILPFNREPNNQTTSNYHNTGFDYGLQDDGFPSAFVNNSSDLGYADPYGDSVHSLRDILGTICPYDATAIGDSLRDAVDIVKNDTSDRARPFAAKTIVILTDGDNTRGDDPVTVARQEIANEDVLVHTITFTPGVSQAGKVAMREVAEFGKGRHYHTDSGEELSRIFEQIANNLPTIVTQ